MTDNEHIMLALVGIGITCHIVKMLLIKEGFLSACQYLVGIALVGYVKDYLVLGGVEYIVESHSQLHNTEVRSLMSACFAYLVDECGSCLVRKCLKLRDLQLFYVVRAVDIFQVHCYSSLYYRFSHSLTAASVR